MAQAAPMAEGVRYDGAGYVLVSVGGRWRQQHRLVAEAGLGRRLHGREVVHHVNGKKDDNRLCNLMVFPSGKAHTVYHAGKPARATFDGRTTELVKPATGPGGVRLNVRIVGTTPVEWRKLRWFQGDLKRLTPESANRLKESIRRNGLIDGFRVWRDEAGVVWILDGHQRRRVLGELEGEGMSLPDVMPGFWVDCRNRAEAAEFVLLYSSQYGEIVPDRAVEFMRSMQVDLGKCLPEVELPTLDFSDLKDEVLCPNAAMEAASAALDPPARKPRPKA